MKKLKPKYNLGGTLLGALDAGSQMALASGNPLAMGLGAAYKGLSAVTGNFGQNDKLLEEQNKIQRAATEKQNAILSSQLLANYNSYGNAGAGVFKKYGGSLDFQGGGVMPLSSTGGKLMGNSHEMGGIDMFKGANYIGEAEGNESIGMALGKPFIGSDSIMNERTGNTYAEDISKAEKLKGRAEKRMKARLEGDDPKAKNLQSLYQLSIDRLAADQESKKQQSMEAANSQSFQYGGFPITVDPSLFGTPSVDTSMPTRAWGNALETSVEPMQGLSATTGLIDPSLSLPFTKGGVGTPVTPNMPEAQIGKALKPSKPANAKSKLGKALSTKLGKSNLDLEGEEYGIGDLLGNTMNTVSQLLTNQKLQMPLLPTQESGVGLQRVNYDQDRAMATKAYRGAMGGLRGGSAQAARAALGNLYGSYVGQQGQITQNEANTNVDIANREAMMNSQIRARNIAAMNKRAEQQAQFDNQKAINMQTAIERDLTGGRLQSNLRAAAQDSRLNQLYNLALSDPRIAKSMGFSEADIKALRQQMKSNITS